MWNAEGEIYGAVLEYIHISYLYNPPNDNRSGDTISAVTTWFGLPLGGFLMRGPRVSEVRFYDPGVEEDRSREASVRRPMGVGGGGR